MLIIFTGNGKGKTTAALGQALRAVGDGKRVLMIQFIKGPWKSGEDSSFKKLSPHFKIMKTGKGFVGICGDTLPHTIHKQAAIEGLKLARKELVSGAWNIMILDEIWNALKLRLVTEKGVAAFIKAALPNLDHLILTGRNCPKKFISQADLVTEMRDTRHPYAHGTTAAKGLEY